MYSNPKEKGLLTMKRTTKNVTKVVAVLSSMAMVASLVGVKTIPAEIKAETVVNIGSNIATPQGSTGYIQHDLGTKAASAVKKYEPYKDGAIAAEGDYLKFTADGSNEENGIRLDITSSVKNCPSGSIFGASLMIGVKDWADDESAQMFFEVTGTNAGKYEIARANPKDSTISEKKSGAMWYNRFLEGEAAVQYGSDSKIYLCVTQNGAEQCYDSVRVWGYPDEHEDATDLMITTPELNEDGTKVAVDVTNLTANDKNLIIDVKDYENGEVVGEDEYHVTVASGLEAQEISVLADKDDVLNITDDQGKTYFKDYKLGSYSWVSTWANAEEIANKDSNSMPSINLSGTTYRQIIRVTTSGTQMRFRFSNQYGEDDVEMKSVHIAKQVEPTESEIDVKTDTVVTFDGGKESVMIPAGETIVSDPIEFPVNALENIAVSTYFGRVPETITSHRGGRATMYQIEGNHVSNKVINSNYNSKSWYYLCDCSVLSPEGSKAVVCFGDSITDGYGTDATYLGKKPDSYTRWGDFFAKRLQSEGKEKISVLNEGIGSNSILGSWPTDAGKDRFERDLVEHDGVGYCIILFGVNDMEKLKDTSKAAKLIPEYAKMVETCHKNNVKVYGAPILPFGTSSYYSEASEQVRTMINDWMRSEEAGFDGIIDFESALIDPDAEVPSILKEYTHEDGLHPYDGYEAMANAIDLSLFE